MAAPVQTVAVPQRRLTLTPIAFDLVLALSQSPDGLRLAELAERIGSPVSSVQTSLRVLMANAIVARLAADPPAYHLDPRHHAIGPLLRLAAVLPEPEHAIGILLRASRAVEFAVFDREGFVIAVADGSGSAEVERLESTIEMVLSARPTRSSIVTMRGPELADRLRMEPEMWTRLVDARRIKGHLPSVGRVTPR